jgi:hypothetical protein
MRALLREERGAGEELVSRKAVFRAGLEQRRCGRARSWSSILTAPSAARCRRRRDCRAARDTLPRDVVARRVRVGRMSRLTSPENALVRAESETARCRRAAADRWRVRGKIIAARTGEEADVVVELDLVLHEHGGIPHARVAGLGMRVDRIDRREKKFSAGADGAGQIGIRKRRRLVEDLRRIREVEVVEIFVGVVFERADFRVAQRGAGDQRLRKLERPTAARGATRCGSRTCPAGRTRRIPPGGSARGSRARRACG